MCDSDTQERSIILTRWKTEYENVGQNVIVETARGMEYGYVVIGNA